ncbi:hypothetical protein OD350_18255 [Clostridium beijerinckii]|uniref:Uncharacterized protein n=1 Tax=Clostridium beijerinckii TaxID=1520 RepID=A0AAX0BAJ5_CLOBE|nr:hypothetical protein [Clostridium beijerinckii]NRT91479.1 hypothetical protein [Clostridium beijerinckii]NYC71004.1 hypothetical protein [Clostridium beijerinckii]UYZ34188.1 hypothetical protein OD350_18255 [Clostridium beijerinckii]
MDIQVNSKSQNYGRRIEHKLRNVFNWDRCDIGGIVNSDFIRTSPYASMIAILMFIYKEKNMENQKRIEEFIEKYHFYSSYKINDIIQQESEEEFEKMMKNFFELIK